MSIQSIHTLLKQSYVQEGYHNLVSLIKPFGKFNPDFETLFDHLCEILKTDRNPSLGLAEKPQEYIPVIVDIDLKIKVCEVENNEDIRLYGDLEVEKIVSIYQSILKKIVVKSFDNKPIEDYHLNCVVLEKPLYKVVKNNIEYYKNGFHLHFPYIFLHTNEQRDYLIPLVKREIQNSKIFDYLVDDSSSVVDSCLKNAWLLYGCKKDVSYKPYLVTKIYNNELQRLSLKECFKHYTIVDKREQVINIQNKERYYLPRLLSINPFLRKVESLKIKPGILSPIKLTLKKDAISEKLKREAKLHSVGEYTQDIKQQIKIAKQLLPLLSDIRSENYEDWMKVGWILYNISDEEETRELWLEFSTRCLEKYDENHCLSVWDRMTKREGVTLGTLHYYAKIDNPEKYAELFGNVYNEDILKQIYHLRKQRLEKEKQSIL